MIDLTPLEVRNKRGDFRRSFRGYDVELVNDFLELVADRMEELVKENMNLSDRVEAQTTELNEYRDKEAALTEALMAAQKLREDARRHAEKESELLIREAKLQAEDARQEVARSLAHEEETLRQVRARRAQLVESFRELLKREIGELDVIEETLDLTSTAARPDRPTSPDRGPDAAPSAPSGIPEPAGTAAPESDDSGQAAAVEVDTSSEEPVESFEELAPEPGPELAPEPAPDPFEETPGELFEEPVAEPVAEAAAEPAGEDREARTRTGGDTAPAEQDGDVDEDDDWLSSLVDD